MEWNMEAKEEKQNEFMWCRKCSKNSYISSYDHWATRMLYLFICFVHIILIVKYQISIFNFLYKIDSQT